MIKGVSINNLKKVFSVTLTAALVVSGFFIFSYAFAAHTATVTVNPTMVKGGASGIYTFSVTNDSGSTNFIYYIKITAPSGFTINDVLVCPSGWGPISTATYITCTGNPNPAEPVGIQPGQQETISFSVNAPASDSNNPWVVQTTDNGFASHTYNPVTLVDATAPSTVDNAPAGWQGSDVTVTLTPNDGTGSGVSISNTFYCVDDTGTCTPTTPGREVSVTCDSGSICNKFVRYYSIDNVGNPETPHNSGVIQIDKEKPATSIEVGAPKYVKETITFITSVTQFTLSAIDNGSGVALTEYKIDNGSWTPYAGENPQFSISSGGPHPIFYRSTDNVGNIETPTSPLAVFVDNIGSIVGGITISPIYNNYISGTSNISATVTDGEGSGVKSCEYTLNGGSNWTTGSYSAGTCSVSGVNTSAATSINIRATDNVNNVGNGTAVAVVPDTGVPSVNIDNVPENWQSASAGLTINCTDAGSGCSAIVGYKLYDTNPGSCPANLEDYTPGNSVIVSSHKWICAYGKDNVENSNTSGPTEIKVDQTQPTITDNYANDGVWISSSQTITLSPQDAGGSGIKEVKYCEGVECNPATGIILPSPYQRIYSAEAVVVVKYQTWDNANNPSDVGSFTVMIDLTDPVAGVAGAPTNWTNITQTATVTCSDQEGLSGCDVNSYKLYTSTSIITECSSNVGDYILSSPQPINSHSWVCAYVKDVAGNPDFSDTPTEFKVDKIAPTGNLTEVPADWQKTDATIGLTFGDTGDSEVAVKYLDVVPYGNSCVPATSYTGTKTVSQYSTACWLVTDNAGNTASGSSEIKVDKTNPVTTITSPDANSWQKANFIINVTDTDDGGSDLALCEYQVQSKIDGILQVTKDWTVRTCNVASPLITVGLTGDCRTEGVDGTTGRCYVSMKSTDNAGNTGIFDREFSIDWTAPSVTLNAPTDNQVAAGSVTIGATVNDNLTTPVCSYKFDGGGETGIGCSGGVININSLSEGHHTLYFYGNDTAGNRGSDSVDFIVNNDTILTVGGIDTDFTSIQAAINAATAGDTISVAAGTYAESVIINKGLILRTTAGAIIAPTTGPGIQIETSPMLTPVTVDGFTITPQGSALDSAQGIVIGSVDSPVATHNITISNNTITTLGQNMGILVRGVGTNGAGYPNSSGLTVTYNNITLSGDSTAFYASWVTPAHTNWSITYNTFDSPIGVNLQLHDVDGVTVDHNIFEQAGSGGSTSVFFVAELSNLTLPIIFSNNDVQGSGANLVSFRTDMNTADVSNTMDNVTVTGNTFNNWVVAGDRQGLGIYPRVTNVTVHQNGFVFTGGGTALRNTSGVQVNATNNWWGTAVLATIQSKVIGTVTITPYYINAGKTILSSVTPTNVYVNSTYSDGSAGSHTFGYDAFATIQDGVAAVASGGTVNVAAGTYDEQVVINKSLTLQGAGDTTIIKPSSAAKLTQVLSGLFYGGGTKQIAGIIVANVSAGSSVTVKNLKVDESNVTTKPTGADYLTGIFYRETGGTVDMVNIIGTGVWTPDRAYGMYLSAAANTVTVEVKDSNISNFDKNGIEADGNTLTVNIHNNTITGRGPTLVGDEVQNGVSVGRDAVATVNYNTISSLEYGPKTWWAAGIIIYHYVTPTGKSATANNNTITNCQIGIMFKNANGVAQDNIVSGGTVGLAGIHAQPNYAGAYTASFVHNTVSGITDYSAIDAETFQSLTPGTGATLTVTISNNTLTGGYGAADGIYVGGSAGSVTATISGNTISGWPEYGINLHLDTVSTCVVGATITGNTITTNVRGVNIAAGVNAANVSVTSNKIFGSGTYGVNNGGSGTLNATANWWGSATGPNHSSNPGGAGDAVSDNVAFRPWYTNPNLTYLDTTPPTVSVNYLLTKQTTPQISGSISDPDSTVVITINGENFTATVNAIVNGNTWTVDIAYPLAAGTYNINATATDPSGNQGSNATDNATGALVIDVTPPTLTPVSIASNNATNTNPTWAKVGDTITLTFTANEDIQTPTVTIAGHTATVTAGADARHWTATYTMASGDTEETVTFTVAFADLAGNTASRATTTDGSSVTFDKTAPVVSISAPTEGAKVNGDAVISFTSEDTNSANNPECSVDNSNWIGCIWENETATGTRKLLDEAGSPGIPQFSGLSQGEFILYVRDTDKAGNIGTDSVSLIKDTLAPIIEEKTPDANAVGVSPDANITVTFSEAVNITAGNVSLTSFTGTLAVTFDSETNTATINPSVNLNDNSAYTITLSGITDLAENSLGGDYSWSFTTAASYAIQLKTGWNLISLPVTPTTWNNTAEVLASISGNVVRVWSYEEGVWSVYNANGAPSDLNIMTAGYGYWVKMTVDDTLTGVGTLYEQLVPSGDVPPSRLPEVPLVEGWNLIGYYQLPGKVISPIENALSKLDGYWSGSASDLIAFTKGTLQAITPIHEMEPGVGYWIFMNSAKKYSFGNGNF